MSTSHEPIPGAPEESPSPVAADHQASDPLSPENTPAPPAEWTGEPEEDEATQPNESATPSVITGPVAVAEIPYQPMFVVDEQFPPPSEERIPHIGHVGLLSLLVLFGLVGTMMLVPLALHFHLFGISAITQAATDYRYALGSQAIQYFITFAGSLIVFPLIWHKPFFEGIHWHVDAVRHRIGRLVSVAVFCFFVAIVNGMLMPGPTNAPIDQLFHAPGAAWVLFFFGITLAPFFEEMAFRGFLLPAFCTAYDWTIEHITGVPRRPLDAYDNPQWSLSAMIIGSVLTSAPFALMHGSQTSWSLGPFLLLIFVSLMLCWVRLSTRSLAASTLVHASYNFMLFSFMLLGTHGFKHLDKM